MAVCEALAAASERRPDRNATPLAAAGGADPSRSAVVAACEALAAASERRPDRPRVVRWRPVFLYPSSSGTKLAGPYSPGESSFGAGLSF